jgi:hypothetical protein
MINMVDGIVYIGFKLLTRLWEEDYFEGIGGFRRD